MSRVSHLHLRPLVALLVIMLPVLGLMVYTHLDARQHAVAVTSAEELRLARLAADDQSSAIQSSRQLLMTLAQVPEVAGNDAEACTALLDRLLKEYPLYQSLSVTGPNGDVFCSAPRVPAGLNFLDRDAFRQVIATRDFVIGDYETDPLSAAPGLTVASPVTDAAGNLRAIVSADINLTQLSQLASRTHLPPGSASLVIDHAGTVLARYPDPARWVGRQMQDAGITRAILERPNEGVGEEDDMDGVRRLYAWTVLPSASQPGPIIEADYVAVGIPTQVVYGPADEVLARNLALLFAATLMCFLIAWELNEHLLVRRINRLLQATERLGAGDFSVRIGIPRQLGDWSGVAQTFNRMAQSIQVRDRELRSAEQKYRTLVEQLPAVTYAWPFDPAGQAYISPQVENILGFSREQSLAARETWLERIHPDDRERVRSEFQQGIAEQRGLQSEYRAVTREGQVIWVHDQAVVVPDEEGKPLYLHGLLQDITDRKQVEEALRKAERHLRSVFDATFQFMGLLAPDGRVVEMNRTALQFGGLVSAQVMGKPFWEMPGWTMSEGLRRQAQQDLAQVVQTGASVRRQVEIGGRDRSATIDLSLRPIKDENGQVVRVVFEGHDITELKQTEQALRASEERWRLQIEHMPIGCIVRDADFRFQYWNPAAERIFKYTTAEVVGKYPSELITPLDIQPRVQDVLREATRGHRTVHGTNANITKDGRMIICEWWNTPLRDTKGRIVGLLSMVQDVTERQRAQEEIAYQANLLANVNDAVIGLDSNYNITFWNRAAERLDGRPPEQVLGRKLTAIVRPLISEEQLQIITTALKTEGRMTGELIQPANHGGSRHVEWSAMALKTPAGQVTGYVMVNRDVTAQKRAEEEIRQFNAELEQRVRERTAQLVEREAALMEANVALQQEEEKLRTLINSIADEVWFCDARGEVVLLNPTARQGLGMKESESRSLAQLLGRVQVFYPDGRPRPVEEAPLFHSLRGETVKGEEIVRHPVTGERRFRHYSSAPTRDHVGHITGAVAVISDMTERKKAEDEIARLNENLERRAIELEKANQELDAFAYSVSHDLRTPLASIDSFARLIAQGYAEQFAPEGRQFLQLIQENATAMNRLIQDLLLFSRASRQPLKKQHVAPAELAQQALEDLKELQAGRQVEVTVGNMPPCQADPMLLKQVYANLLSNALKFTTTRPVARIEIGYRDDPSEPAYFVQDNGVGFNMDRADRLFGVFQRLHSEDEYEGTGVGLAIVERIIHRHGGRVWAEAEEDKGATFYFALP